MNSRYTMASARRLARLWVDMSKGKRREMLDSLETDYRLAVIERMTEIRIERKLKESTSESNE